MSIETFPPGTLRRQSHPVARFNGNLPPRVRPAVLPWRRKAQTLDGVGWLLTGTVRAVAAPGLLLTPVAPDPAFVAATPDDKPEI